MKKITTLILALFVAGIIIPIAPKPIVQAQTISASVQTQLDLIKNLTQQLQTLQAQIDALRNQQVQILTQKQTTIAQLVTSLKQGSSGDNVKILQALLAADPSIYPEGLVTGYYGFLTSKAVRKFQEKHGIEQAGIVGPKTLKKLNEFLKENPIAFVASASSTATSTIGRRGHDDNDNDDDEDREICAIVPPGHLIAKGWLKKHDKLVIPTCQTLPPGIDKKEHEDEDDDDDHNVTSTPDVTAPIISSISAASITLNSATVNWTTNENSDSKVYYSTVNPLNFGTALTATVSGLVTSHSVSLTGLNATTTYYYAVESADASSNTATSSQSSFITTL